VFENHDWSLHPPVVLGHGQKERAKWPLHFRDSNSLEFETLKNGSFSLIERVILCAGAMLLFSMQSKLQHGPSAMLKFELHIRVLSFQIDSCPEAKACRFVVLISEFVVVAGR